MKITDFLSVKGIKTDLEATDKEGVLKEMVEVDTISINNPVSANFFRDDIAYFQIILTNFATSPDNGNLALAVDIAQISGYTNQ